MPVISAHYGFFPTLSIILPYRTYITYFYNQPLSDMKKTFTLIISLVITAATCVAGGFRAPAGNQLSKQAKVPARIPGAILGEAPVYNPEGTEETWIMDATEFSGFGQSAESGEKMIIRRSPDGKTIWFRDLAPLFNIDETTGNYGWIKGSIEGNDITVPAGQILLQNTTGQTLYLETVTMDDWGQFESFKPEMHFTIDGERIIQADNETYLCVYEDGETESEAGFFVFINNISMQPISDIPDFTPPAGVEVETWVMTHSSGQSAVQVARDGNTVYIAGLSGSAPDDFVPGTIENGKLTFKSLYILDSNRRYYMRLAGATEGEPDEFGFPSFNITESYSFDVSDEGDMFTLEPSTWILTTSYNIQSFFDGVTDAKIFRYAGDAPATPAQPEIIMWYPDDLLLQFYLPSEDTEGNYINPEKLAYRIYLDGDIHEFNPERYIFLPESMTDVPYDFTDNYDIYSNGATKSLYLHADTTPQSLKIEAVYTVDGDARTSAPAEWASLGNIVTDRTVAEESYTDMLGRPIQAPVPGTFVIKTTRFSDGSIAITKEIVK